VPSEEGGFAFAPEVAVAVSAARFSEGKRLHGTRTARSKQNERSNRLPLGRQSIRGGHHDLPPALLRLLHLVQKVAATSFFWDCVWIGFAPSRRRPANAQPYGWPLDSSACSGIVRATFAGPTMDAAAMHPMCRTRAPPFANPSDAEIKPLPP